MAITAERLEVEVTADTKPAQRDLDSFSRKTDATARSTGKAGTAATGMGKKFSAAGALVKAAAGTMVAAVAGKTIMAASDLNELLSKTGVVFGPQADIVTKAAQDMADQFGISKATYLDAASGIGLVGKASGLSQKAAAGLSTQFAALAADASSFYDVPIEDALAAMKSGLVGESEPMRQFGVLLSEAAVKNEAYRLGLAATGDELTEQQKVQARASLITKGMSDAQGDLARTQDSVANRLREIRGRLTNFAADMGMKALPAVEKFLAAVIKAPKVIGDMASKVREYLTTNKTMKPILDAVKAGVTAFMEAVKKVPGAFNTAKDAIASFIQENAWVKPLLDQAALAIGAFVAAFLAVMGIQKVLSVFKAIRLAILGVNAAMMANPVGLIIAALVALGVAVYAAYKRFEPFRNLVDSIGAAIKNGFGAAVDWVKAKWAEFGPSIMSGLSLVWELVKTYVGLVVAYWRTAFSIIVPVVKTVFGLVSGYVRAVLPVWQAAFKAMWGVVKAVFNAVKGVVRAGLQIIGGIIKTVTAAMKGDWAGVWNGIKQILAGVWNAIKAVVSGAIGVLKAVVSGGLSVIKAAWSAAWGVVKGLVSKVWDGIKSAVSSGINAVMGLVNGIKGKITGAFSGAAGWLASAGNAIIDGLLGPLRAGVDKVKGVLSSITDKIPDWKGPYEKDKKLLVKNGKAIMNGLIKGLKDGAKGVKSYLKGLTRWIEKNYEGHAEKRMVGVVKRTQARLRKVMEREGKITQRLQEAIEKRNALRDTKNQFIDSMRGGISQQANVLNAGNNASTIRSSLEAQVAKAKEFAANLRKMAGMGYPKDLIAQVAGAGIEGGAEVAKALVAASASDAKGISQAFRQINQIAKDEAKALGGLLYDPGIQAANGLVAGLKKKKGDIRDVMEGIAKDMVKALRKALKIKSPSRVMAALAAFIPSGIAKGIADNARKATSAASRMAAGVTSSVQAGLGSPRGPGGPENGPGGLSPASLGVGTGRGDTHFHFTTNNPVAEPQSRTTNKALDRVASLGLV